MCIVDSWMVNLLFLFCRRLRCTALGCQTHWTSRSTSSTQRYSSLQYMSQVVHTCTGTCLVSVRELSPNLRRNREETSSSSTDFLLLCFFHCTSLCYTFKSFFFFSSLVIIWSYPGYYYIKFNALSKLIRKFSRRWFVSCLNTVDWSYII